MINLRKGKSKFILDASINSAISAVEIYNKPNARFRTETFIVLMIIAWTKLFHAFFQATIGEKYFYKNDNKRFKIVNGEKRAWELSECIKQFNKQKGNHYTLSQAVMANIQFFIGIRNKIEHRHYDSSDLDINLFGECQSLLYNYEKLLLNLFGTNYSLNASLAYSLQFSQLLSDSLYRFLDICHTDNLNSTNMRHSCKTHFGNNTLFKAKLLCLSNTLLGHGNSAYLSA